jgi:phage antirepressor YoqD-like protein
MLAVKHKEFIDIGKDGLNKFLNKNGLLYDLKEAF